MAHDGPDHHHHEHDHHHHEHMQVHEAHRAQALASVGTFVITCSDTRTTANDQSGALAKQLLEAAGHTVLGHAVVKDDRAAIVAELDHALAHGARAIIFTGGTGLSRRDVTIEALEARYDKHVPGFGELFRALSFAQIGSAAMASRASSGVVAGALVFALPGSPAAVSLGIEKLILPEVGHLVRELVK